MSKSGLALYEQVDQVVGGVLEAGFAKEVVCLLASGTYLRLWAGSDSVTNGDPVGCGHAQGACEKSKA